MSELLLGLSLGWAAGISPGPLTALIVTTSLRKGFAGGARVAVAPLITDLPVIVVSVAAVSSLSDSVVRSLGLAGAAYLVWLGVQEMRAATESDLAAPAVVAGPTDVRRGAVTNILNPQMWLFWVTVGAPTVAAADTVGHAALFLGSFYLLLIGTKLALAWLVARMRGRVLGAGWERRLGLVGGVALIVLGLAVAIRAW